MNYFILFLLLPLTYYYYCRKHIDFFTIYFLSSIAYYFPLLFNILHDFSYDFINQTFVYVCTDIHYKTYLFLGLNFLVCFFITYFFDKKIYKNKFFHDIQERNHQDFCIKCLCVVNVILILFSLKDVILAITSNHFNKVLFIQEFGFSISIIRYLSLFITIYSFLNPKNQKKLRIFSCLFIVYSLFLGRRSDIVLCVIGIVLYAFIKLNISLKEYIPKNRKKVFLIIIFALTIMPLKKTLPLFQTGNVITGVTQTIVKIFDSRTYYISESNSISLYVNKINQKNFIKPFYSYSNILIDVVPFSETLGMKNENEDIGTLFQKEFFPEITKDISGLGGTFWGEALINGGFIMLIFMQIIIFTILGILNFLVFCNNNIIIKTSACMIGTFLSFYIHRQYLSDNLDLIKMLTFILILYSVFTFLFYHFNLQQKIENLKIQLVKKNN